MVLIFGMCCVREDVNLAEEITALMFDCVSLIPNHGKIDFRIYYTKYSLVVLTLNK